VLVVLEVQVVVKAVAWAIMAVTVVVAVQLY
jgi:hypothetical protein